MQPPRVHDDLRSVSSTFLFSAFHTSTYELFHVHAQPRECISFPGEQLSIEQRTSDSRRDFFQSCVMTLFLRKLLAIPFLKSLNTRQNYFSEYNEVANN